MVRLFNRHLIVLLSAFFLAVGLAACGGEETERKAFMTFLQTRILDKKGLHVPTLTEEEKTSFGRYAAHYAVISSFNGRLDESVKGPMMKTLRSVMIPSASDLVARRKELALVRDSVMKLKADIDSERIKADEAKNSLEQPDDLKPVFEAAYKRTVSDPAKLMSSMFVPAADMLGAADDVAGWIEEHRSQIQLNGMLVQVSDQKLLNEYNALATKLQTHQRNIQDAQRALLNMINGQ